MTPARKKIYIFGMFVVFVIAIPVIILHSSGYRLNSKFRLVKTGGIYFHNEQSDAIVRLNGKVKKTAGLLERNLLVRELRPATYYARIEKEGYRVWEKNITVSEQKVEVCYPLLIPHDLKPELIPKYNIITPEKKGQKTKRELNDEFTEAIDLFKTWGRPSKGVIPGWESGDIKKFRLGADRRLRKKVFLFKDGNKIYVKWTGSEDQRPFFISSEGRRLVYAPDQNILSFGFFPERDDSMLVLVEDGTLYAVEIDTRFDIQNIYKIARNCTKFAVNDEMLYYVSGGNVYRVDFGQ